MMPTMVQCEELMKTNTSIRKWTSINEVNGTKFTPKNDPSKYIFFPASGHWENTYNYDAVTSSYYLSTRHSGTDDAANMDPRPNNVSMRVYGRHVGCSVRAVRPLEW